MAEAGRYAGTMNDASPTPYTTSKDAAAAGEQNGQTKSQTGANTPQSPANGAPPPIPANKTDLFKGREKEWNDFYSATGKTGSGPLERDAYMAVFGQEGGMQKDQEGSAASGITQGTLDDLIKRGKLSGIQAGTPPSSLTVDQRAQFYKAYFDEKLHSVGGSKALNGLPDRHSAQTLADTVYRQGHRGAAESIQKAANRVKPGAISLDMRFGPQTFEAYKALASDPKTRDRFYQALAEERWNYVQNLPGHGPGDKLRADYFRNWR
ncbi:MAG: hypothetical protein HQL36_06695 [Alphaproteobacteria bacterium]|nr:hypothetical protein [Alphaproteobacteria bacterium]